MPNKCIPLVPTHSVTHVCYIFDPNNCSLVRLLFLLICSGAYLHRFVGFARNLYHCCPFFPFSLFHSHDTILSKAHCLLQTRSFYQTSNSSQLFAVFALIRRECLSFFKYLLLSSARRGFLYSLSFAEVF